MIKKILITSEHYYPVVGGGIEQYIRGLSNYLTSREIEVHILTQNYPDQPPEKKFPEAYVFYSPLLSGSLSEPFKVMKKYKEISSFIEKGDYDLVYSNNHNSLAVIKACQEAQVPVIYGCHGVGLLDPMRARFLKPNGELCYANVDYPTFLHSYYLLLRQEGLMGLIKYFLGIPYILNRIKKYKNNKKLLNKSQGIITVSALLANFFDGHPRKRALILGIDTEDFKPTYKEEVLKKYNLTKENYILCVGRMTNTKGQLYAVQALKDLPSDIKLVLAGNTSLFQGEKHDYGEYGKEIKEYIEKNNLKDRVIFTGFINKDELVPLYSSALATIVPSVWFEPCGYITLESLSCGTPVVITVNSGSAELICPETGIIIPRRDPLAIARAVIDIKKEKIKDSEKIRNKLIKYQDWKIVGQKTLDFFEEIIKNYE